MYLIELVDEQSLGKNKFVIWKKEDTKIFGEEDEIEQFFS